LALAHQNIVTQKLSKELVAGRIAGPFHAVSSFRLPHFSYSTRGPLFGLGMKWQGMFYYDRCLPMAAASSCKTLKIFARLYSGKPSHPFYFTFT
jgi:hypothetical protein